MRVVNHLNATSVGAFITGKMTVLLLKASLEEASILVLVPVNVLKMRYDYQMMKMTQGSQLKFH